MLLVELYSVNYINYLPGCLWMFFHCYFNFSKEPLWLAHHKKFWKFRGSPPIYKSIYSKHKIILRAYTQLLTLRVTHFWRPYWRAKCYWQESYKGLVGLFQVLIPTTPRLIPTPRKVASFSPMATCLGTTPIPVHHFVPPPKSTSHWSAIGRARECSASLVAGGAERLPLCRGRKAMVG